MATELGKAYVQIIPSAKGISGKISKELGGGMASEGKAAGGLFGSNLVGTVTKLVAAAGVGKMLKDTIGQGMEMEQNLGGSEAVFGQYAQNVQDMATTAYKNMGMSASEYLATANKMGSLFQGSGIEQQQALDMTTAAMQRAADVASVMGLDTASAMESIAGAAKGNFTMMDNLGVAMNATTLEAYALEKGLNFKWNTADNAEKAALAMEMFMDRTQQYAGNFARESRETLSGAFGAMQGAAKDLMANLALGEDIGPALSNLSSTIFDFIHNLMPMVASALKGLPAVISNALSGVIGMINLAGNNAAGIVQGGIDIVTGLAESIISAAPYLIEAAVRLVAELGRALLTTDWATVGSNLIQSLDDALFQAGVEIFGSDTGIIDGIKNSITTGLPNLLASGSEIITNIINGIAQALPQIWGVASEIIMGLLQFIVENAPALLSAGADLLTSVINGIAQNLPALASSAAEVTSNLLAYIMQNAPTLLASGVELVGKVATSILNNLPTIVTSAITLVSRLLSTILQNAPRLLSSGIALIGKVAAGIIQAVPQVLAAIANIIQQIVQKFTGHNWAETGLNLIKGIASGIRNAVGEVLGAVGEVAGKITGGFSNMFKIKSPSKVMEDLAQWIPAGIAKGITDNASVVTDAMKSIRADAMAGLTPGTIQATAVQTVLPAAGNDQAMTEALQALADQQTEVRVVLQGDAAGVFKLVRQENNKTTKATGYNLLAMAGA